MKKGPLLLTLALLLICGCSRNDLSHIRNVHTASGANIVCFGDSLTAGLGAGPGEDYPTLLCQKLDVPVINLGHDGDTTEQALVRIDQVFKNDPKLVIVEFGANDYLKAFDSGFGAVIASQKKAFENLRKIVDMIQDRGAIVVIAGLALNADYSDGYRKLAKETHSLLIPNIMEGISKETGLVSMDGVHPNAKGYQKMAETISDALDPLMAELSR